MANKIMVVRQRSVWGELSDIKEYKSIKDAKWWVNYYQEKGEAEKANEIIKAIKMNEKALKLARSSNLSVDDFIKQLEEITK
jgi:hypothetical protein